MNDEQCPKHRYLAQDKEHYQIAVGHMGRDRVGTLENFLDARAFDRDIEKYRKKLKEDYEQAVRDLSVMVRNPCPFSYR